MSSDDPRLPQLRLKFCEFVNETAVGVNAAPPTRRLLLVAVMFLRGWMFTPPAPPAPPPSPPAARAAPASSAPPTAGRHRVQSPAIHPGPNQGGKVFGFLLLYYNEN